MRDLCVKERAVVGEHDKESAHADELMECGVDCKQLPAVRKRSSPKRVLEARAGIRAISIPNRMNIGLQAAKIR